MIILLFGPPGCGKGTQASFIANRYNIPAISTGEMFRAECQAGTTLGKRACSILAQGGLVGDETVNECVANRISAEDCSAGFLLDGYPRTVAQAQFMDDLLRTRGFSEPAVVHLDVPTEVLVRRLSARRQCPKCSKIYNLFSQPPDVEGVCSEDGCLLIRRQDDSGAVIRQRLKTYDALTGPVITHYQTSSRYYLVNGDRSPQEILREIGEFVAPGLRWDESHNPPGGLPGTDTSAFNASCD